MQKILLALALSAVLAQSAEVTAELVIDQEQALRGESMPVRLRISNYSGQTLRLGESPDWLTFVVQTSDGREVRRVGNGPIPKPFTVESARSISVRADLEPFFDLRQTGHYTVRAKVKFPQLEKELTTEQKGFDVISGTKLWERVVGMPGTTPPLLRKYTLQQTGARQPRLLVRVGDESDAGHGTIVAIGPLLSFSQPEATVDASSQMHVLYQNGARTFLYSVITPDGEQIIRQTWDYTSTRPRLHAEEDGRVIVRGGQRRILLSDLPPPRVAETNDVRQSN